MARSSIRTAALAALLAALLACAASAPRALAEGGRRSTLEVTPKQGFESDHDISAGAVLTCDDLFERFRRAEAAVAGSQAQSHSFSFKLSCGDGTQFRWDCYNPDQTVPGQGTSDHGYPTKGQYVMSLVDSSLTGDKKITLRVYADPSSCKKSGPSAGRVTLSSSQQSESVPFFIVNGNVKFSLTNVILDGGMPNDDTSLGHRAGIFMEKGVLTLKNVDIKNVASWPYLESYYKQPASGAAINTWDTQVVFTGGLVSNAQSEATIDIGGFTGAGGAISHHFGESYTFKPKLIYTKVTFKACQHLTGPGGVFFIENKNPSMAPAIILNTPVFLNNGNQDQQCALVLSQRTSSTAASPARPPVQPLTLKTATLLGNLASILGPYNTPAGGFQPRMGMFCGVTNVPAVAAKTRIDPASTIQPMFQFVLQPAPKQAVNQVAPPITYDPLPYTNTTTNVWDYVIIATPDVNNGNNGFPFP